jgi:hypothetical protein
MLKSVLNDLWSNSFSCRNLPSVRILKESQNVKIYVRIAHDTHARRKWGKVCNSCVFLYFKLFLHTSMYKIINVYDLKAFVNF